MSDTSYGFHRRARLSGPRAFKRVFSGPRVSSDRYFRVLARANGERACRLGLAVSRRVSRRAVDRNRIKRVIRESFRHHCAGREGLDFVVLPTPAAVTAGNEDLFDSLRNHWDRVSRNDGRRPEKTGTA